MLAIVQNGEIVKTGSSLKQLFPNTSFPPSVPAEWKASRGVVDVVTGERKDERFYWVTPDNPNIQMVNGVATEVFVNTPKELEDITDENENETKGLKSVWLSEVKDTANKLLQPTDWMVIRKIERDVDIPTDTVNLRANILAEASRLETAITNAEDMEEFITVISSQQWPNK